MRKRTIPTSLCSILFLLINLVLAKHGHHNHFDLHRKRQGYSSQQKELSQNTTLEKRTGGQCIFPSDAGLVSVTPGAQNAGWAMSPNQPCLPGNYCPYACPPGYISMQWDPTATSYSYPKSMNGGLFCDANGNIQKPFPDRPYCAQTNSNIGVQNNCGGTVSFCQTVLPGNEAMLIPTAVDSSAILASPGTDYWCGTAAHYYINPPGVGVGDACVWGTNTNPVGNWSPYVAGANVDSTGTTFIKLGWNPIYLETTTPFRNQMPTWGVKIECPGGGCNGLPCSIDPSQNVVNQMVGGNTVGAGGASFCVVTVPKGSSANFVVFSGSGGSSSNPSSKSSPSSSAPPRSSTVQPSSSVWSVPYSSTTRAAWTTGPPSNSTMTYHRPTLSTTSPTNPTSTTSHVNAVSAVSMAVPTSVPTNKSKQDGRFYDAYTSTTRPLPQTTTSPNSNPAYTGNDDDNNDDDGSDDETVSVTATTTTSGPMFVVKATAPASLDISGTGPMMAQATGAASRSVVSISGLSLYMLWLAWGYC